MKIAATASFGDVDVEDAAFDLLRARIESEVARPAIIAITSCTAHDGQNIAAQALAYSLATAGYSTLFVDTSLESTGLPSAVHGLAIEEIGRRQTIADTATGAFASLALNDATLQRTTSQRGMQSGLDILRSKFDYVVLTTEHGASTAFATTALNIADAVIACVKTRRRRTADDIKLSDALDRLGARYLGIIAMDPSVVRHDALVSFRTPLTPSRCTETTQREHREMAESPT